MTSDAGIASIATAAILVIPRSRFMRLRTHAATHAVSHTGAGLSAAQLANQVWLRARAEVSRYYDSVLRSDDELSPLETRNVCLRAQASLSATASCQVKISTWLRRQKKECGRK